MEECMAMLRTVPMLLALAALGGCTYIGPDELKDKIACLDEDGDTFVRRAGCSTAVGQPVDCDDNDADRFPGNTEKPYDGIDQDCDFQDLVDVDGDRYPGISQSAWEALPEHSTGVEWPTGLLTGADPYTEIDCDDEDNTVFPGSGSEVPYDGVNSSCIASDTYDDWDADGDGHALAARLLPPDAAPYPTTGLLPQDDCDDADPNVHPGTSVADTWYDGIDQNCDGANDFDQDGDGYIPEGKNTAYLAFLGRYDYTDDRACTANDASCWDCNDDPANDGSLPVSAAETNPGATETWYDGVDQDCAGDDDFDQDKDTFDCDGDVVAACSGHVGTDCKDTDSSVNPSALELVGDSKDSDCVGGNDGVHFSTGPYSWTDPGRPAIDANDQHYLLGVTALAFDDRGTPRDDPGIVFTLPVGTAVPTTLPVPELLEDKDPVSDTVALLPDGLDFWFGTTIADTDGSGNPIDSRLRLHHPEWSDPLNDYYKRLSTNVVDQVTQVNNLCASDTQACPFNDFDLQTETTDTDTLVWLVACAEGAVHFIQAHRVGSPTHIEVIDSASYPTSSPATIGQACYLEINAANADIATLHAYAHSTDGLTYSYHEFTLTANSGTPILEVEPSSQTAGWAVNDVHHHANDVIAFAGGDNASTPDGVTVLDGATAIPATAFDGMATVSADAVQQGGVWYVAAVVEDESDSSIHHLLFAYGADMSSLSTPLELTLPSAANPIAVAIYADADRVVLAVTGTGSSAGDDVFAWGMWGYPP